MAKKLTEKQEVIFTFIRNSIHETGFPPTVREIGEEFGITVKGAYDHLKAIEKKGYIRCGQNKSRAIELLIGKEELHTSDSVSIPLLGSIAAGAPILAEENVEEYLSFPKTRFYNGDYFALKVRGDSMIEDGIYDGDIAIIKKQNVAQNGDIIAALLEDEATLKRFKKNDDEVYLIPSNPAYTTMVVHDIVILGKLHALFRNY
jgi:repressor LexA